MKCKHCGAENVGGLERCVACGASMREDEPRKRINLIGTVAALALAVSIFLPYYAINLFGASLGIALKDMDWSMWLPVSLVALGGLVSALTANRNGLLLCGAMGLVWFGIMYYRLATGLDAANAPTESPLLSELLADLAKSMIQMSHGCNTLLAGSVGLIIAGFIERRDTQGQSA